LDVSPIFFNESLSAISIIYPSSFYCLCSVVGKTTTINYISCPRFLFEVGE
jgi:hypothetical protein